MSSADPPVEAPVSLGYHLKRAQHAFRTRIDEVLRPLGLTAPQFAAMSAVEAVAGISNAELARAAFVTPQTMQGILVNLERAGFLTRTAHPEHGRILCNALTRKGLRVLGQARLRVKQIERLLAHAVGVENTARFVDMLIRCADKLETERV